MAKETEKNEEIIQLVSFNIGSEEFGVDILKVQEINKLIQVTKVPNSPVFVEGVINLRGRVIPIVDLRTRLGMDKKPHDKNTRSIVVEIEGKTIGFVVDSVNEVLRIPKNITEAPPAIVSGIDANYITSVAKMEDRLLILLDLDKILTVEEKRLISKVN